MAALVHLVWVTRRQTEQNQQSSYVRKPGVLSWEGAAKPVRRAEPLGSSSAFRSTRQVWPAVRITFVNSPGRCGLPVERTPSLRWNIVGKLVILDRDG